ncbi:MAG: dienelactone hydrolase family protein [Alphaproteobacteria bacterium]
MLERFVDIATADGRMKTFVVHPEQDGPFPPVVLYMDVWGVREQLFDIARRIASVGYVCVVPDLYYRVDWTPFDLRDATGRTVSLLRLTDEMQAKVRAARMHLKDAMVVADSRAILAFLDADAAVRPGPVGSVGYCMGGRHVVCVAAALPDRFRASACLHGTSLVADGADSPHLAVPRIRGELYCGFAEHDPFAPPATIAAMREIAAGAKLRYREQIHPGADHGYAIPDRDIHDKHAAERDWELIFAMYHRQLAPYAPAPSTASATTR